MPSIEYPSEVEACGDDVNIFDSSIFEDIEANGVKIKRNSDGTLTLNGTYTGTNTWNYSFYMTDEIAAKADNELFLSMQKISGEVNGQIRFTVWEVGSSEGRWLSLENRNYSNLLANHAYNRASIQIFAGTVFDNVTIGLKISNIINAIYYSPSRHG